MRNEFVDACVAMTLGTGHWLLAIHWRAEATQPALQENMSPAGQVITWFTPKVFLEIRTTASMQST